MPAAPCFTPVFIIACLYCNWVGSYEFLHELCALGSERPPRRRRVSSPGRRFLRLSLICSWLFPSQENTTHTFTCKWEKSDDMNQRPSATSKRKEKSNDCVKQMLWSVAALTQDRPSRTDPAGPTHSAVWDLKCSLLRTFNTTQLHLINFKCCSLKDNKQNTVVCIHSALSQKTRASCEHAHPENIKDE